MAKPLMADVTVNGAPISAADIAAEAQNHEAPQGKPGLAWRKAARALVIRELLLQQARDQGLKPDPREVAKGKFETGEEAQIRAVMEDAITPESASDDVLRSTYDKAPERFRAPSLFEPAHILFAVDPNDAEATDKAMKKAKATLEILAEAPNQFARIAKDNSDCPSRDNGGQLGQIASGDTVPEFEAALLSMDEGQLAPTPVLTRYGVHLIRLDAKAMGAVLPFEAVRDQIAEAYEKMAWAKAAQRYVENLLRDADVTGLDLHIAA